MEEKQSFNVVVTMRRKAYHSEVHVKLIDNKICHGAMVYFLFGVLAFVFYERFIQQAVEKEHNTICISICIDTFATVCGWYFNFVFIEITNHVAFI